MYFSHYYIEYTVDNFLIYHLNNMYIFFNNSIVTVYIPMSNLSLNFFLWIFKLQITDLEEIKKSTTFCQMLDKENANIAQQY